MCLEVRSISLNPPHRRIIPALIAVAVLAVIPCAACKRFTVPAPPSVSEPVDLWKEAVTKVEQDRGEAAGRKATGRHNRADRAEWPDRKVADVDRVDYLTNCRMGCEGRREKLDATR